MVHHFYQELLISLPNSSSSDRGRLAQCIIDQAIPLQELLGLLSEEYKVATRFAWLLSGVGMLDKEVLRASLDDLLQLRSTITSFRFDDSIIKYWRICGIPTAQEGIALTLLFDTLLDNNIGPSIKTYAMYLLYDLSQKHKAISSELESSIVIAIESPSASSTFRATAARVLQQIRSAHSSAHVR